MSITLPTMIYAKNISSYLLPLSLSPILPISSFPYLTPLFFWLNRKFYYITLLRDPVSRYLSEWRHVQRGATWKTSLHMCDGRTPTPEELPSCYEGSDWSGCTLQQFMDCPYNLANNRQVCRKTLMKRWNHSKSLVQGKLRAVDLLHVYCLHLVSLENV